jgi:hypothetical protein
MVTEVYRADAPRRVNLRGCAEIGSVEIAALSFTTEAQRTQRYIANSLRILCASVVNPA